MKSNKVANHRKLKVFQNIFHLVSLCVWSVRLQSKSMSGLIFSTLRPRQNRRHSADDILKCIFLNESVWVPIEISLKFVPYGPIDNIPALVQIMAWRRPGDKPLSETMVVNLLTHICVTRPQWVKRIFPKGLVELFGQVSGPFDHYWRTLYLQSSHLSIIMKYWNRLCDKSAL